MSQSVFSDSSEYVQTYQDISEKEAKKIAAKAKEKDNSPVNKRLVVGIALGLLFVTGFSIGGYEYYQAKKTGTSFSSQYGYSVQNAKYYQKDFADDAVYNAGYNDGYCAKIKDTKYENNVNYQLGYTDGSYDLEEKNKNK